MFMTIAFFSVMVLAVLSGRQDDKEHTRRQAANLGYDAETRETILHARQDIRLAAFFLAGILVMLGVIADRVH